VIAETVRFAAVIKPRLSGADPTVGTVVLSSPTGDGFKSGLAPFSPPTIAEGVVMFMDNPVAGKAQAPGPSVLAATASGWPSIRFGGIPIFGRIPIQYKTPIV
jgi:hypothetical protein